MFRRLFGIAAALAIAGSAGWMYTTAAQTPGADAEYLRHEHQCHHPLEPYQSHQDWCSWLTMTQYRLVDAPLIQNQQLSPC